MRVKATAAWMEEGSRQELSLRESVSPELSNPESTTASPLLFHEIINPPTGEVLIPLLPLTKADITHQPC